MTSKTYDIFCVARQPIIDRDLKTYGYELLFRNSFEETEARFNDRDIATLSVLTSGFLKCEETIDQSKRVFVNFTQKLLMDGAPRTLPPGVSVIEVLEDVVPTKEILEELIGLKQDGYFIALDDYVGENTDSALLDIADIIKIDVLNRSREQVRSILQSIENNKALKLAEKVEERGSYEFFRELGFDLFQGFFFAKPETLTGKKPKSYQTSKLRILAALNDPDIEIDDLTQLIGQDPSITYRLLRLINAAAFGFSMKIESIKHAVVLLGKRRVCYWLRMLVLSDMNSTANPDELLLLSLFRGKVLEELTLDGQTRALTADTSFLFGMFSLLDVILELPFDEIFKNLPLPNEFYSGYLDERSELYSYIDLLHSLERGNVMKISNICSTLHIDPMRTIDASTSANIWCNSIANAIT